MSSCSATASTAAVTTTCDPTHPSALRCKCVPWWSATWVRAATRVGGRWRRQRETTSSRCIKTTARRSSTARTTLSCSRWVSHRSTPHPSFKFAFTITHCVGAFDLERGCGTSCGLHESAPGRRWRCQSAVDTQPIDEQEFWRKRSKCWPQVRWPLMFSFVVSLWSVYSIQNYGSKAIKLSMPALWFISITDFLLSFVLSLAQTITCTL